MRIDIRLPMGLMFSIMGLILAVFGLVSRQSIYDRKSLGININLWWGIALLVFGFAMLGLTWRAAKRRKAATPTQSQESRTEPDTVSHD